MYRYRKADSLGFRWSAERVGYTVLSKGQILGNIRKLVVDGTNYWYPVTKGKKTLCKSREQASKLLLKPARLVSRDIKSLSEELL